MGRKGSWFTSVKKALSPHSKNANKSKNKGSIVEKPTVSESPKPEYVEVPRPQTFQPLEEVRVAEVENDERTNRAYSVAVATAAAAEAAAAAAKAAAEAVRLSKVTQFAGKSKEEVAAIRIQTAFRGYLARRALRALRGLVRLKTLVDGPTAKRQTANTLKTMQTLSRVHSQVQSRRIRMAEENRALQRQILQKRAKELESLKMGEDWDDSLQSKEKIEANLLHKYEAAMRRERALAYSYTHQQTWKKSSRSTNLLFMDPTNPHWGWSWLERYMASQTSPNKDANNADPLSSKTGEITKSFARHQLNSETIHPSPSPSSKPSRKFSKPSSPRGSQISPEEDSRSIFSIQSERNHRRHTIAGGGSSVRDDESLGSSPAVPSYMAPTRSAKAKLKLSSPSGFENGGSHDKGLVPKKRLSFPASPGRVVGRRHSGPPKVEATSNGVVS